MKQTDEQILQAIKKGDKEAFTIFVKKYKNLVFRTVLGFVYDKDTAEDLTQEVFVKLWQNIDNLELKAKLSTWLYRVATNHAINFVRKKKLTFTFSQVSDLIQKKTDDGNLELDIPDNSGDMNQYKELLLQVKIAVNKLPKRQRIAFVLNKFNGMDYKDIAEVMDLSYSAVDALINRAKKNLQKQLKKYLNYEL